MIYALNQILHNFNLFINNNKKKQSKIFSKSFLFCFFAK